MMQLEFGGAAVSPCAAGETVIGSAPGSAIVLEGEGVQPRHAIVQGTAAGRRRASGRPRPEAEIIVNGVRLGADPTPRAARRQDPDRRARDPRGRIRPRRAAPSCSTPAPSPTWCPAASTKPATPAATGGRLVCLTDGREYTIGREPARVRPGRGLATSWSRERGVAPSRRDPGRRRRATS